VRLGGSRAFGLWSKYFADISDSRGLGINKGEGGCESGCENGSKSNKAIHQQKKYLSAWHKLCQKFIN
jgi:hypothetical protein